MDRRTFLSAATGLGVAGLAGCAGSSASGDHDIGMRARRYEPASVTVTPGTTVVWRNTSAVAHTVTARADGIPGAAEFFASGGYDSVAAAERAWVDGNGGALSQSETFEHEFTVPGEYAYYCIPHEAAGMVGVVTVSGDADGA